MIIIDDMKVCQLHAPDFETETFRELENHATFKHKEECEFIFYISEEEEPYEQFNFITNRKNKEEIIEYVTEAETKKYKYICIYA